MLDVYTYAGGFALNAMAAGAQRGDLRRRVGAGARAGARARRAQRHHAPSRRSRPTPSAILETVRPRSYDIVVLDPPKFARARKDLDAAIKGYQRLNTLGMTACAEGALLATCSCSQLVDEEAFERMMAGAAKDAGRRVQLLVDVVAGAGSSGAAGVPRGALPEVPALPRRLDRDVAVATSRPEPACAVTASARRRGAGGWHARGWAARMRSSSTPRRVPGRLLRRRRVHQTPPIVERATCAAGAEQLERRARDTASITGAAAARLRLPCSCTGYWECDQVHGRVRSRRRHAGD